MLSTKEVEVLGYDDGKVLTVADDDGVQYELVDKSTDSVRAVESIRGNLAALIQWDLEFPWIAKLFPVVDGEIFKVDINNTLVAKKGRWCNVN